ncbi:PREDICTED: DNA repair-scaffolding protein-like isoform X2 [Priapulus caudatus]|uniref:DNA repair-scaffolding protein-like isoform X2 n=1 Tax=Priapulus caudatus TaxID=37621 RepID=A0ABM1EFB1_PRICU|nr:PREDICTED: DNA repair-scaffolding protein-like isoform X2 [Priapulus caudatus]
MMTPPSKSWHRRMAGFISNQEDVNIKRRLRVNHGTFTQNPLLHLMCQNERSSTASSQVIECDSSEDSERIGNKRQQDFIDQDQETPTSHCSAQLLGSDDEQHPEDGTISEFDSSEEGLSADKHGCEYKEDTAMVAELQNIESPAVSEDVNMKIDTHCTRKGSDWLKCIRLKTPQKRLTPSPPEDSAKKRKNQFVKGGLAEKLHKLQCSESSALSFWKHSMAHRPTDAKRSASTMHIKVLQLECIYSIYFAVCQRVISKNHVSVDIQNRDAMHNNKVASTASAKEISCEATADLERTAHHASDAKQHFSEELMQTEDHTAVTLKMLNPTHVETDVNGHVQINNSPVFGSCDSKSNQISPVHISSSPIFSSCDSKHNQNFNVQGSSSLLFGSHNSKSVTNVPFQGSSSSILSSRDGKSNKNLHVQGSSSPIFGSCDGKINQSAHVQGSGSPVFGSCDGKGNQNAHVQESSSPTFGSCDGKGNQNAHVQESSSPTFGSCDGKGNQNAHVQESSSPTFGSCDGKGNQNAHVQESSSPTFGSCDGKGNQNAYGPRVGYPVDVGTPTCNILKESATEQNPNISYITNDSRVRCKRKVQRNLAAEISRGIDGEEQATSALLPSEVMCQDSTDNEKDCPASSHRKIESDLLDTSYALESLAHGDSCEITELACDKTDVSPVGEAEELLVLFMKIKGLQLKIKAGSIIKIHPPWQQLRGNKLGKPVILCTNFSETVRYEDVPEVSPKQTLEFLWKCPCRQDINIPPEYCPASLSTAWITPMVSSVPRTSSCKADEQDVLNQSQHLETIDNSQVNYMQHSPLTMLESIERSPVGAGASGLCITGKVCRVFCQSCPDVPGMSPSYGESRKLLNIQERRIRWALLLEDSAGMCCELQLSTSLLIDQCWQHLLAEGEGQSFLFTRLRIVARTTAERHPQLFSVIRKVADSESSLSSNKGQAPSQDFCYMLTATPGESKCQRRDTSAANFHETKVSFLQQADGSMSRYSVCVRVVHSDMRTLYCIDASTHSTTAGYVKVHLREACHIPTSVIRSLSEGHEHAIVLRDLCQYKDGTTGDGYSRVLLAVDKPPCSEFECAVGSTIIRDTTLSVLKLPTITMESKDMDLVMVSGTIVGADEDTAFSWPVCNGCGSETLKADPTGSFLFCETCNRGITEPIIKMKLDVFLDLSGIVTCSPVVVQLQQKTIETVLPPGVQTEGYELDGILGRQIGPLNCFVKACPAASVVVGVPAQRWLLVECRS